MFVTLLFYLVNRLFYWAIFGRLIEAHCLQRVELFWKFLEFFWQNTWVIFPISICSYRTQWEKEQIASKNCNLGLIWKKCSYRLIKSVLSVEFDTKLWVFWWNLILPPIGWVFCPQWALSFFAAGQKTIF